jgi:uncharacterized protein YqeY
MSTFDTSTNYTLAGVADHVTGKKVMSIMEKYLNQQMSEEMLDNIIQDIKLEFGEDHPAKVNLDDETNDIQIIVKDSNGRYIKCSSLTLFPNRD